MLTLTFESWLWLLRFELLMKFRGFEAVHRAISRERLLCENRPQDSEVRICHAIDLACVFYFKRVLCLQRSAATTVLLRRYGWNAQMVIGAQLLPFQSHAWVEVDDRVVNDKPYVTKIFQVMERC